jgi:hypothetical protein
MLSCLAYDSESCIHDEGCPGLSHDMGDISKVIGWTNDTGHCYLFMFFSFCLSEALKLTLQILVFEFNMGRFYTLQEIT